MRRFNVYQYTTREIWSRRRRIIGKAEWTQGEANPRFVSPRSAGPTSRRITSTRGFTALVATRAE
jgi:hypothetical protein